MSRMEGKRRAGRVSRSQALEGLAPLVSTLYFKRHMNHQRVLNWADLYKWEVPGSWY
jgi:hypothetical protein